MLHKACPLFRFKITSLENYLPEIVLNPINTMCYRLLFKKFSNLIKKKYNSEPALFTNNISQTLKRLNEWNSDIKYICTPINPKGYRMKPNQKEAENSIKKTNRTVIGYDITCGGTLKLKESIKYAKKLNVDKVVVEISNFPIK